MTTNDPQGSDHPRGTLAVVAVYGLLFLAGWLALYFLTYKPRGPVLP
jgi:hypothetical protein